MSQQPFSKSADANKDVILEQLRKQLKPGSRVLEIASGTGQHAVHFARHLPYIKWQPSDHDLGSFGLVARLNNENLANIAEPIALDVLRWPDLGEIFDAVYSANCIHVMPPENLQPYIEGAARSLCAGGAMMLYGPFKYDGAFTTQSNASFNEFLVNTYPGGGIRDFEIVDQLASKAGFFLESDTGMPANNQFIVWRKRDKSL